DARRLVRSALRDQRSAMVERTQIPRCSMSTAASPSLGGFSPKTSLIETDLAGRLRHATDESTLVKPLLIGASLAFLSLVLFVPLAAIFAEALRKAPRGVA